LSYKKITLANGTFKVKPISQEGSKYFYQITTISKGHGRKLSGKWKVSAILDNFTTFERVD
jgi:hypothetical protein